MPLKERIYLALSVFHQYRFDKRHLIRIVATCLAIRMAAKAFVKLADEQFVSEVKSEGGDNQ